MHSKMQLYWFDLFGNRANQQKLFCFIWNILGSTQYHLSQGRTSVNLYDFWEFLSGLEQAVSTLPSNLEQNNQQFVTVSAAALPISFTCLSMSLHHMTFCLVTGPNVFGSQMVWDSLKRKTTVFTRESLWCCSPHPWCEACLGCC